MKLALTLPGGNFVQPINQGAQGHLDAKFKDLGTVISPMLEIILYIATFLAFYYLIWGAFNYLMAKGGKEDLAKARARITWAIIGLVVIFLSFIVIRYFGEIFKPTNGGLPF